MRHRHHPYPTGKLRDRINLIDARLQWQSACIRKKYHTALPCASSFVQSCFLFCTILHGRQHRSCWLVACLINLLLLLLLPLVVSGRHFFSRPPQDQFVRDKGHARVGNHPQQRNGQARVKARETTVPEPDAPTRRHEPNISPARIHHATADHCDVKVLIDTQKCRMARGRKR